MGNYEFNWSGLICNKFMTHSLPAFVAAPAPPLLTHAVAPQLRLPKLSIKKLSGDLTRWVSFWDSFNSSIHSNPSLSSINYLVSLVESAAAEAIAGLTITSANYDVAIATLKKRFGNTQLIVNRHMEALLGVATISSHYDIKGMPVYASYMTPLKPTSGDFVPSGYLLNLTEAS